MRGAYSLVVLVPGRLIAVRDPLGFRPLVPRTRRRRVGRRQRDLRLRPAWAPSTCATSSAARSSSSTSAALHSFRPLRRRRAPAPCVFEHVYFARPDSTVFGQSVQAVRKRLGARAVAASSPPMSTSSFPCRTPGRSRRLGYAAASGLPFEMGLVRNHYVGRTFIEPSAADPQLRRAGEAQPGPRDCCAARASR